MFLWNIKPKNQIYTGNNMQRNFMHFYFTYNTMHGIKYHHYGHEVVKFSNYLTGFICKVCVFFYIRKLLVNSAHIGHMCIGCK